MERNPIRCNLTEQDKARGWVCPLDNPNENVKRCEDCAFGVDDNAG